MGHLIKTFYVGYIPLNVWKFLSFFAK